MSERIYKSSLSKVEEFFSSPPGRGWTLVESHLDNVYLIHIWSRTIADEIADNELLDRLRQEIDLRRDMLRDGVRLQEKDEFEKKIVELELRRDRLLGR